MYNHRTLNHVVPDEELCPPTGALIEDKRQIACKIWGDQFPNGLFPKQTFVKIQTLSKIQLWEPLL
jgi:hypothetical protein